MDSELNRFIQGLEGESGVQVRQLFRSMSHTIESLEDQLRSFYSEASNDDGSGEPQLVELDTTPRPQGPQPVLPLHLRERVSDMKAEEADRLDFGAVKLTDEGVIEIYNRWESEMAGIKPSEAIGKHFFTEIAPCTNNRLVYGRFQRGVEKGELDVVLPYTFTYRMRPTNVRLQLLRAGETNWIFVTKDQP